jgi:hypothetical protein
MMVGGQAVAIQNQLNFSRDMEREADRIGYGLMEPSGFAPQGFVSMFDKLQQANRLNDNGSWPYLRKAIGVRVQLIFVLFRLPGLPGEVSRALNCGLGRGWSWRHLLAGCGLLSQGRGLGADAGSFE